MVSRASEAKPVAHRVRRCPLNTHHEERIQQREDVRGAWEAIEGAENEADDGGKEPAPEAPGDLTKPEAVSERLDDEMVARDIGAELAKRGIQRVGNAVNPEGPDGVTVPEIDGEPAVREVQDERAPGDATELGDNGRPEGGLVGQSRDAVRRRDLGDADVLEHAGRDHGVEGTRDEGKATRVRDDEWPASEALSHPAGEPIEGVVDSHGGDTPFAQDADAVSVPAADVENASSNDAQRIEVIDAFLRRIGFQDLGVVEELDGDSRRWGKDVPRCVRHERFYWVCEDFVELGVTPWSSVGCERESAAYRTVGPRGHSLPAFPQHEEQGCTHGRASHIWYEVTEAAVALAGETLCQLNIGSHGQHCARRNQKLSAKACSTQLSARHQEEDGKQHDVLVVREREEREGNVQSTFARSRMEAKTDTCREEEKAQSDEGEIRPARGAKRKDPEDAEDYEGQGPDHSQTRLTVMGRVRVERWHKLTV